MPKYLVHVETTGHIYLKTEADSREEAINNIQMSDELSEINCGELEDIECTAIDAHLINEEK